LLVLTLCSYFDWLVAPWVWPLLPDTEKCKVCGRLYEKLYLHGHTLPSHSKRKKVSGKSSEAEVIEEILSLFQRLSKED